MEPLLKDLTTMEKEGIFLPSIGKRYQRYRTSDIFVFFGAHSLSGLLENLSGPYICRFCIGDHSDY